MGQSARISVVIVSYRVRELLRRCLGSVFTQQGVETEAWVVDNASEDGTCEMVETEFPAVRLIKNAENLGFARANNQALAKATGDPMLLLNPDTELPAAALRTLVQVFQRHPEAGAVGLAMRGPDGAWQPACHSFPGVLNISVESIGLHWVALRLGAGTAVAAPVPRGGEGDVDWVAGACFALSRAAYERVGGLDSSRFMYGEEMDWSWRARKLGFKTVFSNTVTVSHQGGASGFGLRGTLFVRNLEARLKFLERYRGAWRAALARELLTLGALLRLAYWAPRAVLEAGAGGTTQRTRDQVERFRAVLAWRLGRAL